MGNVNQAVCVWWKQPGTKTKTRSVPREFVFPAPDELEKDKWHFQEILYDGSYAFVSEPEIERVQGKIRDGIAKLKSEPGNYYGIFFQTDMINWPIDQQKYSLAPRNGSGFNVSGPEGEFTYIKADYYARGPIDVHRQSLDAYTDTILAGYEGYRLGKPLLPGRGDGVCDSPLIKIIGDVDPNDVFQGGVGDCWLLSAISTCADFEGVIEKILEHTDWEHMPNADSSWNRYTVVLYELPSYEAVAVEVDERLCSRAGISTLLGCKPSPDGELWACIIEKAVAAHCGGWDEIDGGQCSHAWKILLGVRECCSINNDKGDGFRCYGDFNPNTKRWDDVFTAPHKNPTAWEMEFPELGGGRRGPIDADDLFRRMMLWDRNNYIIAAASKRGSGSDKTTTQGVVDSHAYGVLKCIETSNGTQLIQMRNPWGKTEFEGKWSDDAAAWDANPDVYNEINPIFEDDGVFWMEKDEFFTRFDKVYLCPVDMREWVSMGSEIKVDSVVSKIAKDGPQEGADGVGTEIGGIQSMYPEADHGPIGLSEPSGPIAPNGPVGPVVPHGPNEPTGPSGTMSYELVEHDNDELDISGCCDKCFYNVIASKQTRKQYEHLLGSFT